MKTSSAIKSRARDAKIASRFGFNLARIYTADELAQLLTYILRK